MPGSSMSMVTRSGRSRPTEAIASSADRATATTSSSPSCSITRWSAAAYVCESSQIRTRGRVRLRHAPTIRATVSSSACWSKLSLTM